MEVSFQLFLYGRDHFRMPVPGIGNTDAPDKIGVLLAGGIEKGAAVGFNDLQGKRRRGGLGQVLQKKFPLGQWKLFHAKNAKGAQRGKEIRNFTNAGDVQSAVGSRQPGSPIVAHF